MEGNTTTLATILDNVGDVFEAAIGWVGTVAQTIAEQPILLIFCIIPMIGLGVGLFRRLINVH